MKKYIVEVNCGAFRNIEVEAHNKEEAKALAEKKYICPDGCPEASDNIQIVK